MTTILVSSLAGIHQNSNLTTGGGTDDTTVIQAALTAGPFPLTLIQDGVSLISGLNVSANTTIQCSNSNCGFYLANASNREILRNVNRSGSTVTDTNITINGGYYNGNKSNQSGVSQADHTPMTGFGFYGIDNLLIENLTVFNASAWAIGIGNYSGVTVNNCALTASTAVSNLNTDGVDLRGPGTTATLSNLTILSGDDAIALNARAYANTVTGPYIVGGSISGVTISNITLTSSCFGGIDIISDDTFSVSGVTISGVSGAVQNYALYFNRDVFNATIPTHGGCSSITVSGMSVTQSGSAFLSPIPIGLYLADCTIAGLSLSATVSDVLILPTTSSLGGHTAAGSITNLTVGGWIRSTSVAVVSPCSFGSQYGQSLQIPTSGSGSSMAVTLPGLTVEGTTLVIFVTTFVAGGHTVTGVTDGTNTWVKKSNFNDGATGHTGEIWIAPNLAAGARTITVNLSSAQSGGTLLAAEYMFSTFEQVGPVAYDTGSETTVTCPGVTTTHANDIVIGVGSVANTGVTGQAAGFSARQIGVGSLGFLIDSFQATTGTYTPSVTTAANAGNYRGTLVLTGFVQNLGTLVSGLPIFVNGVVNNNPLNGGYESSFDYHVNSDGSVATSTTKSGSAYLSTAGWLRNPTGEIVLSNSKNAGAYIGQCGVLVNTDGTAVSTTSQTNPFINSRGLLVNQDGSMIVNNGGT